MSMSKEVTSRTIASVIAGIILAVLFFFWTPIKPFFTDTIPDWASVTWSWLVGDAQVPRYVLLALIAAVICAAWRWMRGFLREVLKEGDVAYLEFTEFKRWGIVWRWHWTGSRVPVDLSSFCPRCDRRLIYQEDRSMFNPDPTEFMCQSCNLKTSRPGKYAAVEQSVLIEMDHVIRTSSWKEEMEAVKKK